MIALSNQPLLHVVAHLQLDLAFRQPFVQFADQDIDDVQQVLFFQRMEDHEFIDSIQKFRAEIPFQFIQNIVLHALPGFRLFDFLEAEGHALLNELRAQVGRHHQDRVLEIDLPPQAIRKQPVVQDLQEHVEDIRMSFFDLIEQHHRIRAAPHFFGQLPALFIAHVTRRGAEQPGTRKFLLVFRHVNSNQGILGIEQELRQSPGQFGLADTRRSQENEGPDRLARLLEAGPRAANGATNRGNGFFLTHDTLVEKILHVQQLFRLFFFEFEERNTRDFGDHKTDFFGPDHRLLLLLVLLPIALGILQQFPQAFFFFPILHGLFKTLQPDGDFLFMRHAFEFLFQ